MCRDFTRVGKHGASRNIGFTEGISMNTPRAMPTTQPITTPDEFRTYADAFAKAYVEAMFWSSTDDDGTSLDANYDIEDLAPATIARIVSDCAKFQAENGHLLTDDACKRTGGCTVDEQAGHDFWLTRNGHGVGFWDGDWHEPAASQLTRSAKAFGSLDAYIGDDGKIYF